ncbi:MAG: hypothetical protein RMK90_13885 [Acetobacteraceae bacterium]|nr:hypothetical protein [Acetobacteraceae bacterium]
MARSAFLSWLSAGLDGSRPAPRRPHPARREGGTLVIGAAAGYGPRQVKAFVASLRAVHDGPAAILTDRPEEIGPLLERFGVDCLLPAAPRGYAPHPASARFLDALQAIESLYPAAETILLSDVRDVVFQADPFAPPPRRLSFFLEAEPLTLAQHGANLRWIAALAGAGLARMVADRPCICSGTLLGPRADMLRLIRQMLLLMAIPRAAVPAAFGADQAAVNLVAHLGLAAEADILPNHGRVATIGMTPPDQLALDPAGVIRNPDGGASAIVHQYDRHPALLAAVEARWKVAEEPGRAPGRRRRGPLLSLVKRLPELR